MTIGGAIDATIWTLSKPKTAPFRTIVSSMPVVPVVPGVSQSAGFGRFFC